jgi:hypothetical protein
MKKLLLFYVLLTIGSVSAQVDFINETFNSGAIPLGWNNNDIAGNGEVWQFNNPGGRTINAPVSGGFAIFDSDNYGFWSSAEEAALETPSFDATGRNKVIIKFSHYFEHWSTDHYYVEVFNGTSWVSVLDGNTTTANATAEFIDISAHVAGISNAKVRFRYVGDNDWYWAIDNILIFSPPNNDDCATAEELTVGRIYTDNDIDQTDLHATNYAHANGTEPNPSCGNFGNGFDLWYKVTAPAGGNFAVETRNQNGTITDDTVLTAYTGICGSLSEISCNDDGGENYYSRLKFTGRIPGEVIYIRAFEYGNDAIMDFKISAFTCFRNPKKWDGTNWRRIKDNGIAVNPPNIDVETRIEGSYNTTTNGSFSTCSCEITTGNTLTITDNNYVEIDKNLINNGIITINNNGSLVQNDINATISGTGTYSMERITSSLNDINDYTYWSSPMTNHTLGNMISTTRYYDFNASVQNWRWRNASDPMIAGTGYIAKPTSGTISGSTNTINFTGAPFNTGTITTNMELTTINGSVADDSWNLIGNPYPSGVDANALVAHNSTMNGTLYFWTHITPLNPSGTSYASSDYATWNATGSVGTAATSAATGNGNTNAPSGIIAAGQGFFAQANASGNIAFTNAMRVTTGNNNFYRTQDSNTDRIWLNLTNTQEAFKQQLIGFLPNATDSIDRLYDGLVNNGNGYVNFYSLANNEKFVILANDLIETEEIIPLGYESNITSTFTISIDHLSGDLDTDTFNVYLKDLELNITHNLKESGYTFETEIGTFDNRFELFIQRSTVLTINNTTLDNDKLIIIQNLQATFDLSIANNKTIESVIIFNTLGQQLYSSKTVANHLNIKLGKVVKGNLLIFRVKTIDGKNYIKKIIKN